MAALISATRTRKGGDGLRDKYNFNYVGNGSGLKTINWRCSNRKCKATLTTRKSTGNLVGGDLPDHTHGNQLLKMEASKTEKAVLAQYAGVHGAKPATVLQEISHNMLSSNFPGQLNSASSSSSIRMKLWRQRQIVNPRPPLPTSFQDYMKTDVPDKFTKAADGGEFMVYKNFVDLELSQPLVMFVSQWAIDILRNHSTWLFDGTFKSAPKPFTQVLLFLFSSCSIFYELHIEMIKI